MLFTILCICSQILKHYDSYLPFSHTQTNTWCLFVKNKVFFLFCILHTTIHMYVNQYIKFYVLLESWKYEKQATIITTMPRIVEPANTCAVMILNFLARSFWPPLEKSKWLVGWLVKWVNTRLFFGFACMGELRHGNCPKWKLLKFIFWLALFLWHFFAFIHF